MQVHHMEDVRAAYIKLVCVLLTLISVSFCAGFALAHLTAKPQLHVIRVPVQPPLEV